MKVLSFMLVLYSVFIVSGCSTVMVSAKVKHPSEINMTPYNQVAVMDLKGNYGRDFAGLLKSSLTRNEDFSLLNCESVKRKVETTEKTDVTTHNQKELSDLEKGAFVLGALTGRDFGVRASTESKTETKYVTKVSYVEDPNPNCTKSRLASSAIIQGYYDGDFTQNIEKTKANCKDKDKKDYVCYVSIRSAKLVTKGSVDVIDADSGNIIKSKVVGSTCNRSTRKVDGTPAVISENELKQQCMKKDVSRFVKTVTPWTQIVRVAYVKDSDLPQLEAGIKFVKMGDYVQAIATFQEAIDVGKRKQLKPKIISMAYWNLGLAYEYSWQFEKALKAFDSAYMLKSDSKYLSEKSNVQRLMVSRDKLLSQSRNSIK